MARFWGTIGINREPIETRPGVFEAVIEEIEVNGEVRNQGAGWPNAGMRDGITAAHVLSIVTPEDSDINFAEVAYVVWQGQKWSVESIRYNRPRVDLSLGGLYSG